MNCILFKKYLREGKQHIASVIPVEKTHRVRGLSVARVLTEVTIKREENGFRLFSKRCEMTAFSPFCPMSTSDPDQQITMNLLTNQCELNSATVLGNTNLTHIDYLLCAKHCSRPFT